MFLGAVICWHAYESLRYAMGTTLSVAARHEQLLSSAFPQFQVLVPRFYRLGASLASSLYPSSARLPLDRPLQLVMKPAVLIAVIPAKSLTLHSSSCWSDAK